MVPNTVKLDVTILKADGQSNVVQQEDLNMSGVY